jgi:hypothetical protein
VPLLSSTAVAVDVVNLDRLSHDIVFDDGFAIDDALVAGTSLSVSDIPGTAVTVSDVADTVVTGTDGLGSSVVSTDVAGTADVAFSGVRLTSVACTDVANVDAKAVGLAGNGTAVIVGLAAAVVAAGAGREVADVPGALALVDVPIFVTPGVNFTNILCAAFSYESFFAQLLCATIWVCNFLAKGFWRKSCS